ncbi:cytochrome P450 [Backusella circina FSU 941]|nr:cytochrome P450 [Backusella circina FSU 941]
MSIIKNYFLNTPFLKQLQLISTNKKKVISVTAASSFILFLIYSVNKLVRPPKNLRHIPYQSFFQFCVALLKNESIMERSRYYSQKYLDKKGSTGLYMRPGRLGWEIHVTDPESIRRIFLKHEFFVKTNNPSGNTHALSYKFTGRNIALLSGDPWKKQRKVINPAFHRAMPLDMFGQLTIQMFDEMEKLGDTIDFTDMMERFTLDAIGKAGFGFDFNAISDHDNIWVNTYHVIRDGIKDPLFFLFPGLDKYMLWLFPQRRETHACLERFHKMLDKVIAEKREMLKIGKNQNPYLNNDSEKDLLTLMLESDKQDYMTDQQLKDNLCVFFVAGHDTTANTMASMIYYLAKNSDIQEKARQEAFDILGEDAVNVMPAFDDLKKMRYINQIIKETLRMNGPATVIVPRVATQDTELSGTFIPKGSLVNVNIYDTHHRETFWRDPLRFDPDRFGDEQEKNRTAMSWVPFGNGARQCIGMNFSLAEQQVMLSMLLRKYNFELPKDSIHQNGIVATGVTLIGPKKMDIIFKKRY